MLDEIPIVVDRALEVGIERAARSADRRRSDGCSAQTPSPRRTRSRAGRSLIEGVGVTQEQLADAGLSTVRAPARRRGPGVGQQRRPIDDQERPAADPDVAAIAQRRLDVLDEREVVIGRVLLRR